MKEVRLIVGLLCCAVVCAYSACSKNAHAPGQASSTGTSASNVSSEVAANPTGGENAASSTAETELNTSKYDAEIAHLEKEAEKNPGDETSREALSQAYLRRANAFRKAQQYRQTLRDYQSALRLNPDNEEAQQSVAEIVEEMGGEPPAENFEPAPLPITPGTVASDDEPPASEKPKPKKSSQ